MSQFAPKTIYLVVDETDGSIKTGGGSSTRPAVHAYLTEEEAQSFIKVALRYNGARKYAVVKYTIS